ncbi:hypothetical protein MKQ70_08730 [Chitinophaga sedimenti]|uniref:hypothetical protein n=1 Tax=Chitinophaga sedimenti TaxID=2033606 RepID=UPI0020043F67|nr:hypothetical protein [Chitinophaga sedimenti]MCK7555088.1 hypothetical protein [Chitinophaga sedimenti]
MANSDNVLRGGLTPKHIDVPELLKHTRFEAVHPVIVKGVPAADKAEFIYPSPAPDFQVSRIVLAAGETYQHTSTAAEILILMSGAATVAGSDTLELVKGQCAFVAFGEQYSVTASASTVIFKAGVPA